MTKSATGSGQGQGLITLFSIPKPFRAREAIIQSNALQSWARLGVPIVLYGDEFGVKEAAAGVGAKHVPFVERNRYGTPLLREPFESIKGHCRTSAICYVNSDIILTTALLDAVSRLRVPKFLAVGRRVDCVVKEVLDFSDERIDEHLKALARAGSLHPPTGSDFFVFPRDLDWGMPDFAVGRPAWDNWLIGRALQMGVPVIELSRAFLAIHQEHSYAHVPGRRGAGWEGPEADRNRELAGGRRLSTLEDATHALTPEGAIKARSLRPSSTRTRATRLAASTIRWFRERHHR